MRILIRAFLVALVAASVALAGLAPPASAETSPQQATVITPDADRSCAGDVDTLVWARPDVAGLTGYRIVQQLVTASPPLTSTHDVGADQTTLTFTAPFGVTAFLIYSVTSDGPASDPFATTSVFAGKAPQPMQCYPEGASVGDGTATVPFRWPGPVTLFTTGGLANTVRITASPGGTSIDVSPDQGGSATATFEGLANGAGYTFDAVTFNACGSSTGGASPTYTPGLAPAWTRAEPPLEATPRRRYVYKFAATGDPCPTYRLLDAPSWLRISPRGRVSGRPPAGTESFSYSVVAGNGVGIAFYQSTEVVAGPFTVSVPSG